jgi:hypothetical protein
LGPALLQPFDGPNHTALTTTWQPQASGLARWPANGRPRIPTLPLPPKSTFAVHQAQAAYDGLLRGLDGSTTDGHITQAQLRSVASPCASAWLEALSAASSFTLSDSQFGAALYRLPTLPCGTPTVTCFCSKALAATDLEHPHTYPPPMRSACCTTMILLK